MEGSGLIISFLPLCKRTNTLFLGAEYLSMTLLIRNIKTLVQVEEKAKEMVRGKDMGQLPSIDDAFLLIEGQKIVAFGQMKDCPQGVDKVLDGTDKMVFPCWCDSHTHLVYAGSREQEFVDRINGLSYEEIAKRGGGILNSAKRLQDTHEEELLEDAYLRICEIKDMGTGAVEIKSGYGLTLDAEMKMLAVIKKLSSISPLTIKATFLGAHAIPPEYENNRQDYIELINTKMLPKVADEGLAEYVDVFCDRGFFTPEETEEILLAADKFGLKPKIHANELANSGGVQVAVKHKALSIDHLEQIGDEEISVLKKNDRIMVCIMPSVAFFLNINYAPARKMIDEGLPIALASDYNPGSSPSGNMGLVLSLACLKLKMTPEEAINGATINGAYAMELSNQLGSIAKGKLANVFITKKIPSPGFLPYSFGSQLIETVIIKGEIQ